MAKGILIGIVLMLCVAAVPYGAEFANVYVRQMDTRDTIYSRVIMPNAEFIKQHGGLTERNVIWFNLSGIPEIITELQALRKEVDDLKAYHNPPVPLSPIEADPNSITDPNS